MRRFLLSIGLISLWPCEVIAQEPLEARVELNWRYGHERSILMSEFWIPVMQDEESVLYTDIRMMGDDHDHREGNIGLGYRKMVDLGGRKGIIGAHGWLDRRLTERGSNFNQITGGAELYTDRFDLKLNTYIPLNDSKTHTQTNPNGGSASFVGNQIVVNTDQILVEEALIGADIEFGWKPDFLDQYTDSTRLYGSLFHFEGDRAEDISGWRTRLASDITPDIELGASFQSDDVRGSQGFLEATIRFPLGHKKSYQKEGLRARLDESPERDIDIVSNEAITDDGLNKPLTNATTGLTQNVIHVNNTAAGGGNGSVETPYNTLAAAEAAASDNDLIYIHRGDGTTTGQNAGISLNDQGQTLMGAGSDLTFDGMRFGTSNGATISSITIIPADPTGPPTITNTGGDGISVTANNIKITGLTIDGATDDNIQITNAGNTAITEVTSVNATDEGIFAEYNDNNAHNLTVRNVTSSNNGDGGIYIITNNASTVLDTTITQGTFNANFDEGIRINSNTSSLVRATITNNTANNNSGEAQATGIQTTASNNSHIISTISGNTTDNNAQINIYSYANTGATVTSTIENNTVTNALNGILLLGNTSGATSNGIIRNNTVTGNGDFGIQARANNDTTVIAEISGNTVDSTTSIGIYLLSQINGNLTVTINNNISGNNNNHGIYARAIDNSSLTASFDGNTSYNNTGGWRHGFYIVAEDTATANATLTNNTAYDNDRDGFLFRTQDTGDLTLTASNNLATSNSRHGFWVLNEGNSLVSTLTSNTSTSNISNGYRASIPSASSGTLSISMQNNISTNNTLQSFYFTDTSTGSIIADMGGGSLGSTGNNSSYNNGGVELYLDLDGDELKAENNWWGNTSGLIGGETTLIGGSTVDADPYLTQAP